MLQNSFAKVVTDRSSLLEEAWTLKNEDVCGVSVAPSVVEEGQKALHCGLVGFLKSSDETLQKTEFWI